MTYSDIDVMRSDISKAYVGDAWKKRVKYMPDTQVFAIWNRLYEIGRFNKATNVSISSNPNSEDKPCIKITQNKNKRVEPVWADEICFGEQLAFDI